MIDISLLMLFDEFEVTILKIIEYMLSSYLVEE